MSHHAAHDAQRDLKGTITMGKNITKSKKFQALLAVLDGDQAAAVRSWNTAHPDKQIATDEVADDKSGALEALLEAGFDRETALAALAEPANTPEPENAPAGPLTSEEKAKVLVAQRNLIFVRGRVYSTKDLVEAQVRVLKSGKPEIVTRKGDFRTKGVAVYRLEDGETVALQNLGEQN